MSERYVIHGRSAGKGGTGITLKRTGALYKAVLIPLCPAITKFDTTEHVATNVNADGTARHKVIDTSPNIPEREKKNQEAEANHERADLTSQ